MAGRSWTVRWWSSSLRAALPSFLGFQCGIAMKHGKYIVVNIWGNIWDMYGTYMVVNHVFFLICGYSSLYSIVDKPVWWPDSDPKLMPFEQLSSTGFRSPERHFQMKRANYRHISRWIMAPWECRELWQPMEYSYGVRSPFGQSFGGFGELWLWATALILYWSSLLASMSGQN